MRKIFYGLVIVFGLLLIGSFDIQDIHAQLMMPCIQIEDPKILQQKYFDLSNPILGDWKLQEISMRCGSGIGAIYEIPEFSSKDTKYQVKLVMDYHEFANLRIQDGESFLIHANNVISYHISKLHSNEYFKEIDDKLNIQTVSFIHYSESPTIYDGMRFDIRAIDSFGNNNRFSIDVTQNHLKSFVLANNIDLESFPALQKARNHGSTFLTNLEPACQIKQCTSSFCGSTQMSHRHEYKANIQVIGEHCPPKIKVILDKNLELSNIYTATDYNYAIKWPPENELKMRSPLRQSVDSPFASEYVTCNKNLDLIFKLTDGFPACVTSETAEKLIERNWGTLSIKNVERNPWGYWLNY